MMISAVTGFTVLNGRVKETMVPVAYAIPLHASVPLPSASSNLVSAAGSGLTSGAALCAALTPAAPDAMEAAVATVTRLEERRQHLLFHSGYPVQGYRCHRADAERQLVCRVL